MHSTTNENQLSGVIGNLFGCFGHDLISSRNFVVCTVKMQYNKYLKSNLLHFALRQILKSNRN